jgi:hypothetical protein
VEKRGEKIHAPSKLGERPASSFAMDASAIPDFSDADKVRSADSVGKIIFVEHTPQSACANLRAIELIG